MTRSILRVNIPCPVLIPTAPLYFLTAAFIFASPVPFPGNCSQSLLI